MIDSCRARKLEAGIAAMYSKPRNFRTSTMKSAPGWSSVKTSTSVEGGSVSAANSLAVGKAAETARAVCVCAASPKLGFVTRAAVLIAAPFKKPRRLTRFFLDFSIAMVSFISARTIRRRYCHVKQTLVCHCVDDEIDAHAVRLTREFF